MVTIEVDVEVMDMLKKLAEPFIETSPNHVLRRILGLGEPQKTTRNLSASKKGGIAMEPILGIPVVGTPTLDKLRELTPFIDRAFLTFLLDKYHNSRGNFSTGDILSFMKKFHLVTPAGKYWNPWMEKPYGAKSTEDKTGKTSCQRTIEHFRQCRRYACWGGRDVKRGCDRTDSCSYHPDNPSLGVKKANACKMKLEVIWKRSNPRAPYTYGARYIEIVKEYLLNGETTPLRPLLEVFYQGEVFSAELVNAFRHEFHINEREMSSLFSW
ncbi:MAG: hypothetical protein JRC92_06920 [Deltaproteobacteria bacterium]|nr:hypothetical protein [Deltaproteobacteria bacterium]